MEFVRTPENCFERLADYPFTAHYCEIGSNGMRMHYLDEGPASADPVLMLHGEPSWSYLYRHMIPIVAAIPCVVDFFFFVWRSSPCTAEVEGGDGGTEV